MTPDTGTAPNRSRDVRPDGVEVLIGYYEAVAARTAELLVRRAPPTSIEWSMNGGTRRSPSVFAW